MQDLKAQMDILIKLQNKDLEQEALRVAVDQKRQKVNEDSELLDELEQTLTKERDDLDQTKRLQMSKETEKVETNKGLEHAKEKLNVASNSRDYATLEQEVENFKKMQAQIETEIENLKTAIENAETVIAKHEEEYNKLKEEIEKASKIVDDENASIEGKVNSLKEDAAALAKQVKPEIMQRYKFIRSRRPGKAVVSASKGTCEGCHMKLQPQMFIKLQRQSELICCQNCQRILYFSAEEHAQE